MKSLLLAALACLLLVSPLELSAKHVVRHHTAKAQGCSVGQTPPSTGCGIGDMSVGGALSTGQMIAICQQAGGCPASATTWQLTKIDLLGAIHGALSASTPLNYNPASGAFSLTGIVPPTNLGTGTPSSSLFLNGAGVWATPPGATGGVTIPTSPLLSGNSTSTLGSVAVGNGLMLTGTYPTQTLSGGPVIRDPGPHTVTAAEWSEGAMFVYTTLTTSVTPLTFPSVATLSPQGGITVQTTAFPVTLTPNSLDGINGYATAQTQDVAPYVTTVVTTSGSNGTTALNAILGEIKRSQITYGPGQNLSTSPLPILNQRLYQSEVSGVTLLPGVLVTGGTATIDIWAAPETTPAANVTTCTGGAFNCVKVASTGNIASPGVSGTTQVLGFPSTNPAARIPPGAILWIVGGGTAWGTPANYASMSGLVQVVTLP